MVPFVIFLLLLLLSSVFAPAVLTLRVLYHMFWGGRKGLKVLSRSEFLCSITQHLIFPMWVVPSFTHIHGDISKHGMANLSTRKYLGHYQNTVPFGPQNCESYTEIVYNSILIAFICPPCHGHLQGGRLPWASRGCSPKRFSTSPKLFHSAALYQRCYA